MYQFKHVPECRLKKPTMSRIICFSFLFLFLSAWPVWGATYYMRADGKAVNKAAATSCSSASTAMSVATHNAETFSPDDVICLCDGGGDFKTSIIVPSSGTNGHPVIYKNADGHTPIIDLSVDVGGSSGWADMGRGVYRKKGYGRVLWEDDAPLKAASSELCNNGNWYYPIGAGLLYYKPTSGTPADHTIRTMWFESNSNAIDLRNRSNITVYGLSINRSGYGIKHGQDSSSPTSPITNIILHDNKFTRTYWAIYSDLKNNGIESDVSIYNNNIDHCNCGISSWTTSDETPGHSQHHTKYSITGNKITNLYSITDTKVWSDALLTSYYYTDHEGISFQDVQDSVISGNTITTTYKKDMTSDECRCRAIFLYLTNSATATSGNSILRNYISGHFNPSIYITTFPGHKGFDNNIIAYNLVYYGLSNTDQCAFIVRATSDNLLNGINYFVNNTIYNASVGLGISVPSHNIGKWIFRNNIVKSPSHVSISSPNDTGSLTFDHNLYDTGHSFQVEASGMEFSTWQNKYKYDTIGSNIADSLFVYPGTDFHLKSGSPAIGTGASIDVLKDNAGKNPDIGAY